MLYQKNGWIEKGPHIGEMGRVSNLAKEFRTPLLFLWWFNADTIQSHLDALKDRYNSGSRELLQLETFAVETQPNKNKIKKKDKKTLIRWHEMMDYSVKAHA